MWYVLGATDVAFAGIGNGTLKRLTWAKEGAASPGATRSRVAGSASIPPAPIAPLIRNCCLDSLLLVISLSSFGFSRPKTKNQPLSLRVAGCTTGSTRPQCPYPRGTKLLASTCLVGREDTGHGVGSHDTNTLTP